MIQPSEIKGPYDVLFVGKEKYVVINVSCVVQDLHGNILWFEGADGAIYNWSNVLVIRKARG